MNTNTGSGATPQAGSGRGGPQADHIQVQHILIGFKDAVGFGGSAPPKASGRTQDQARTLAYDLYNQAKGGADFDQLVAANTDDAAPGIYGMSNTGIEPAEGEYPREGMVPAFGNVGFTLDVGEIGVADYDPATSPYGYHIIKRVK
ncbi:MAG TPA: peptidylprolyl isomerase [Chloroflexia bacterium]|nr:peptidylprolyl isomerase [Chloroflexia bacterium]